jgi:hypothetical protein
MLVRNQKSGRHALLVLILGACFLVLAGPASAEELPEIFSEESLQQIAAAVVADQNQQAEEAPPGPPATYRPFWVIYGWLTAATIFDIESTFYRLNHCEECQEANPIMRPFIERGRLATYAFSLTVNGVVMVLARRMYDRRDSWWRVGALTFTIVHAIAGTLNLVLDPHGET